jgi:hypothetical protein
MASASSTWKAFEILYPEISFAAHYASHQRFHTKSILKEACKLLTSFVHRDINVLRFWSNVSDGIYSDLISTMTENEIPSRLIQESTHTGSKELGEMIAPQLFTFSIQTKTSRNVALISTRGIPLHTKKTTHRQQSTFI